MAKPWTEEQRQKFKATMAKKKKQKMKKPRKAKKHGRSEDAIIYLRHAVSRMEGTETMSQLLTKLALKTLEGE